MLHEFGNRIHISCKLSQALTRIAILGTPWIR